MAHLKNYSDELIQRGIRLALERDRIAHLADDLAAHPDTLRMKMRQFESDNVRRADQMLRSASLFFEGETGPERSK